jgi:hypothetical protein
MPRKYPLSKLKNIVGNESAIQYWLYQAFEAGFYAGERRILSDRDTDEHSFMQRSRLEFFKRHMSNA